jgi:hypothetical protein
MAEEIENPKQENENKIEISKEGYLKLLSKVYANKLEERELALDRYRTVDEQMDGAEQFVLMGRNAVSFLTLASTSSSDIANIAKEIKSIVYKDSEESSVNLKLTSDFKNQVSEHLEELEHSEREETDDNKKQEE